jgi:hypothetical protein
MSNVAQRFGGFVNFTPRPLFTSASKKVPSFQKMYIAMQHEQVSREVVDTIF